MMVRDETDVIWLAPDQVFDGHALREHQAVGVQNGRVVALVPRAELPIGHGIRAVAGTLTPGFIDLQVNGGGGCLMNNQPTRDAIAAIAAAHRTLGTVGLLPTVITDAPEVLARAVGAVLAVRAIPGVIGLHIEGPHLSVARRGTHAAAHIRPFEPATLAHVVRLRAAGLAVMITVAPETVSGAQIRALADTGAVVSLGHSDADAATTNRALAAGATAFTHLFNAMSPMLSRAPGMTGAAINSTARCGIICDGIHVDDAMVALAIRARPEAGRMFLVSDAMASVGGPDSFSLYGALIRVREGRLENAEGSLAGAHITMAQSVRRLILSVGVQPETALRMAITVPADLMRQEALAQLVGRDVRDVLWLHPDWTLAGRCAGLHDSRSGAAG